MSRLKITSLYTGRRVLVVGLGLHGGGVATVQWLARQGAIVRVIDSQPRSVFNNELKKLRRLHLTMHFGSHRKSDFLWAERIVVNPAVSPNLPELRSAERRGIPVENEALTFVRENLGTLIGVTGTRGKTTTTLLLGSMLKRAHTDSIVSGNVRQVPMLAYLPSVKPSTWSVLELSSYQLERLPVPGKSFRVAILTNIKTDHLNRHGTLSNYAKTKFRLFAAQNKSDTAVLNADDPYGIRTARSTKAKVLWFGKKIRQGQCGITIRHGWVIEYNGAKLNKVLPLSDWHLLGEHNQYNLLAAVAGALAMRVPIAKIRSAVRSFRGLPHRQEIVGRVAGHRMINDTSATSPDGTLAALNVFPDAVFIIGGTDKQLDFRLLARTLVRRAEPLVVLPGTATEKIIGEFSRLSKAPLLIHANSMSSAVRAAINVASPGQDIVLSPGAASFGLFRHEFHRGEEFIRAVKHL